MLMFTGPSRALSCAAGIQQGVDRHNRRGEERHRAARRRLDGRGGRGGRATTSATAWSKPRDCAIRPRAGRSSRPSSCKAMVGRHSTHEFASVGDLELQGHPRPRCRSRGPVGARVRRGGDIPMPSRLVGTATEGSVRLLRPQRRAHGLRSTRPSARGRKGHPEVVLLEGEPGIGKTTLAAQVARTLHGDGATVLFGQCSEGMGVSYRPWIDALTHLIEHAPQQLLDDSRRAARCRALAARPGARASRTGRGARRWLRRRRRRSLRPARGDVLAAPRCGTRPGRGARARRPAVGRRREPPGAPAHASRLRTRRRCWSSAPTVTPTSPASTRSRAVLADLRREPVVTRLAVRGLDDAELLALVEGAAGLRASRRRRAARARAVPRDRRQPVLHRRAPSPPLRDRCDRLRRQRSVLVEHRPRRPARCRAACATS